MTFLTLLEYNGAALGILGSLLVVSQSAKVRAGAFAIWTASNISLIALFMLTNQYGLLNMQAFFLGTSVIGFVNNLRAMKHPPANTDLLAALAKERELSKEKSKLLAELRAAVSKDPWSEGTAPGNTWLLVKDGGRVRVAKLIDNPCVWFDDHDRVLTNVTAWKPLL